MTELQTWFGAAIAIPLPEAYEGNPLALSSPSLASPAGSRLRSKGGMGGFDRLGVYNQQYWFRLISVMQSDYTAVIHLMGLDRFNGWAVKYLTAQPPASPYLADLDKGFPAFLAERYAGPDREAVIQAAAYERALSRAFDAPDGNALDASGLSPTAIFPLRLELAPHVSLVQVDWDFAEYRLRCLEDESLEARVDPPEPGSAHLVIHRDRGLNPRKTPLPAAAWAVLKEFPGTLEEVFARLEGRLDPAAESDLHANLGPWFQSWVAEGWLCLQSPPEGGGEGETG